MDEVLQRWRQYCPVQTGSDVVADPVQGFARLQVYLNGASCRLLNDNAAFLWKRIRNLEMESFDYNQVFIPKSSDPVDEVGTQLDMARANLERPETMGQSVGYFLLTILPLPVLPVFMFLIARWWRWQASAFRARAIHASRSGPAGTG
jgi:hypothetical protein